MRAAFMLPAIVGLLMVVGCSTQPKDSSTKAAPPVASTSSDSSPPESKPTSEIPLTASEEDGIRPQIENNWNVSAGADECPIEQRKAAELLVHLDPDGAVTKVEPVSDLSQDKCSRSAYESARRAVMLSSPLKLPPGKTFSTILLRFHPGEVAQ